MRASTRFNYVKKPEHTAVTRKVGQGAWNPNLSRDEKRRNFMGFIRSMQAMPTYNVPVIDSVTLHYDGPLTTQEVNQTFTDQINPLGASTENPPAGCSNVDTTFAEPGKFQTFALICAIQWRLDIEPIEFTVKGNSWSTPATSLPKPVSPDMFNVGTGAGPAGGDTSIANGTLGLGGQQTMTPADLEWGWWQGSAFFHQVRGYNLVWQYGHNYNLVNDTLRYTAFLPSNAQDGSASSSQVDTQYFARRTNDYYRTNLNSPQIFLTIDRARLGNMTLGTGEGAIAGLSVYRPTRAYDLVGATYGGAGLRNLVKGNQEFRRLSAPFLAWPGVPLGLKAVQQAQDDAQLMRNYLDASYGLGSGAIPASFTEDVNVAAGAGVAQVVAGFTGQEPSLDTPIAPQFQQLTATRNIFKGGGFKITVAFKGFELTPDQAQLVGDIDFQTVLRSECGCGLGPAGSAG
jgi:hypothetical protein